MCGGSTDTFNLDRIALFLDVDGTLLEFAPSPWSAVVPEGLVSRLAGVETALGGALALVSGRTVSDLDRLFQPLRVRASGVHGAEIRFDPMASADVVEAAAPLPGRMWRSLNAILTDFPGAVAENKRFSFAIHYRAAPCLAPRLRDALRRFARDEASFDVELVEARLAYELKAPGFDKGSAIRRFMARAPFAGRLPVFVGDDATDEAGFAAVADMGGYFYSVGRSSPAATDVFADPTAVRQWLDSLVSERVRP